MAQPSPLAGGGLTEPVPLSILAQLIPPMLYVEETEADGDGDVDYLDDRRPKKSKLGVCKKAWTPAEDWMLQEIVEKNGAHRWSTVATYLPGRMGKQCRERCARAVVLGAVAAITCCSPRGADGSITSALMSKRVHGHLRRTA